MSEPFPLATSPASAYPDGTILAGEWSVYVARGGALTPRWWGGDGLGDAETNRWMDSRISYRSEGDPLRVLRYGKGDTGE